MSTLSEFTTEIHNRNVFKNNLYQVQISMPGNDSTDARLVSMWCSNAHTPQSLIMTDDNYLEQGMRRKFAYDHDWGNLNLTFYLDQDFKVKLFFDKWKDLILPRRRKFNYPEKYTAESLRVEILKNDESKSYLYEYKRIYPKMVSTVDLSYQSVSSPGTLNVEFVFEEVFITAFESKIDSTTKVSTDVEYFTNRPTSIVVQPDISTYNTEVDDVYWN